MANKREPIKLNDNNWLEWRAEVRGKLYLEKVNKAIIKPTSESTKTSAETKKETEDDELAKVIIEMNLSHEYLVKTEHCKTAWELWELLTEHFEAANKNLIPTNVERLTILIKEPPEPEKIVLEVRGIAAKLEDVKVNSTDFLIPLVAAMLPSEFNDLRSAINNKKTLTLTEADNMIKLEAKRKGTKTTIAAQNPKKNKPKKKYGDPCTYCMRFNHQPKDCFHKPKTESGEKEKASNQPNEKSKCTVIRSRLCKLNKSEKDVWYLDSGAGTHSVCKSDGFVKIDKHRKAVLESANGEEIEVKAIGTYEIQTKNDMKLVLQDCHYAPDLIGNFLSASKINKHGMDIILRKDGTVLVMDDDGLIAQGYEENGMYRMYVDDEVTENRIAAIRPNQRSIMDWHRALGHLNFDDILKLGDLLPIYRSTETMECKTCLIGKSTRLPFKRKEISTTAPLDLIHTDLSGIIRVPAVEGLKYFLTFIDDYSRYTTVYLLKSKEQVFEKFIEFKNLVENKFGSKIKALRSDNGTEYTNKRFQTVIKESGINHTFTQVGTPQQNGVSERMNRTIKNGTRCIFLESGLPARFWPFAVKFIVQARNASPNSAIGYETPNKRWNGKETDFRMFHPFGSHAIVHKQNTTSDFDARGVECRLLQMCDEKYGYLLIDKEHQEYYESRDVKFIHENDEDNPSTTDNRAEEMQTLFGDFSQETTNCEEEINTQSEGTPQRTANLDESSQSQPETAYISTEPDTPVAEMNQSNTATLETDEQEEGEIIRLTDRQLAEYMNLNRDAKLQALPLRPTLINSGKGRPAKAKAYKVLYVNPIKEVIEKLEGPDGSLWKNAMDDEYNSLISNNTWTLTKAPEGAKIIKTQWILTEKNEVSGIRFKARFVAKGFTQRPGIDFTETFAPVMRKSSVRLLIAFACRNKMLIHHVDVKTAYLNADLAEEIYIDQPFGYETKTKDKLVCRLNKAIYGLKQSARCWNDKLNEVMSKIGLKHFASEECIFANKTKELIVGTYVDDLLILSTSLDMIDNFKKRLSEQLVITDKGEAEEFLGINIRKTTDGLALSQKKKIEELICDHDLFDSTEFYSPMSTTIDLNVSEHSTEAEVCKYQSIVGSLMYIASSTRPDIQYSTSKLAQYMAAPTKMHINAAVRVLKYLKTTKEVELVYKDYGHDNLEIHANADFANSEDSRSISGVAVFFGGNLVEWSSTKQQLVALATCEAEINSIKDGACDAIYFRELLNELDSPGHPHPVRIYNDNLPGQDILEGGGKFKRSKHYKLRLDFVKQLLKDHIIDIRHLSTRKMIADAFTKALPEEQHNILMSTAGMDGL